MGSQKEQRGSRRHFRYHKTGTYKYNKATGPPPRSIIINFQEYTLKESIFKKAWVGSVPYEGQRMLFNKDHAAEVARKCREYGSKRKKCPVPNTDGQNTYPLGHRHAHVQ